MRWTSVSSTSASEPFSLGRWSATPTTLQGNLCHRKKGEGTKSSKHLEVESAFIVVESCLTLKSDMEKLMDESSSGLLICPLRFQHHKPIIVVPWQLRLKLIFYQINNHWKIKLLYEHDFLHGNFRKRKIERSCLVLGKFILEID